MKLAVGLTPQQMSNTLSSVTSVIRTLSLDIHPYKASVFSSNHIQILIFTFLAYITDNYSGKCLPRHARPFWNSK